MRRNLAVLAAVLAWAAVPAMAEPAPHQADFVARDFRFHTGESIAALNLHYTTLGDPAAPAVLVLHGTGGSGADMLSPAFGGELFGPGQPLDAAHHFIILPDAIGAGGSTRPSNGLRMKFPQYNYDDLLAAQYRLVTEGLGLRHLRLVMGNSMGGMLTWMWGEAHPDFMDGLVPLASTPAAMAGRNWMLRRMLIQTIKADPAWKNGDYTSEPPSLKLASTFFALATSGGNLALGAEAPTRAAADRIVETRLAAPTGGDANDAIYQWDASRDYDPSAGLAKIAAPLLAINSADDERNPPETGILQAAIKQVKNGRYYLIPASAQTRGHGTTASAKFWKAELARFLATLPRR